MSTKGKTWKRKILVWNKGLKNKPIICLDCKKIKTNYSNGRCKKCWSKIYYHKNKVRISEKGKIRYLKNKEKYLNERKLRHSKNKERDNKLASEWYYQNKEKRNKQIKEYQKNNIEKLREGRRKYQKTDKGRMIHRLQESKRRSKKRNLKHLFTKKEWLQKVNSTLGVCPLCDTFVDINKLTLDHIIPIAIAPIGFGYTINDVQPICKNCNSKKWKNMKIIW